MFRRIFSLCLLLMLFSSVAYSYDTQEFVKDFKELVELGNRVYKSSVKASRVISDVLVKDGKPNDSIVEDEVEEIQTQLTTDDNDNLVLQASEMQTANLDEFAPKPNNFNTQALEKLISVKRGAPSRKAPEKKEEASTNQFPSRAQRRDKKLVKKVFPDANFIQNILTSTNNAPANPKKLGTESADFREKCTEMFNKLAKRGETAARIKFLELLNKREYKNSRWYFAGLAAMVAGFPAHESEDAIKKLKKLVPELQKEAKVAAKAIDWDFAVAIEDMPKAKKSLMKSIDQSKLAWHQGTLIQKRSAGGKRGWWPGSNDKDDGKLSTSYWKETWTHMWGDMADHLQSNFDRGTEYGEKAGSFIGTVSGIGESFGKMAAERTAYNIVQQVRDYAHDSIVGQLGLKPDPYSIVGHYAGGAIGTVGGAIGNAAGWFVGTVESIAAQRSKRGPSRSPGKKGVTEKPQTIKLF